VKYELLRKFSGGMRNKKWGIVLNCEPDFVTRSMFCAPKCIWCLFCGGRTLSSDYFMAFCQLDGPHSFKHQAFFSSTEYKLDDCFRLMPFGAS